MPHSVFATGASRDAFAELQAERSASEILALARQFAERFTPAVRSYLVDGTRAGGGVWEADRFVDVVARWAASAATAERYFFSYAHALWSSGRARSIILLTREEPSACAP